MNKKTALIVGIIVGILLLGGGIFALIKFINKPVTTLSDEQQQSELPSVAASVKVELTPKIDKKSVVLKVSQIPSDTESIEYEFSYTTGAGLPKGAIGKIDLKGKTDIEREILLGTCSTGGKCTYDTGVTSVKLVLKFNESSGPTQYTKEYPLE